MKYIEVNHHQMKENIKKVLKKEEIVDVSELTLGFEDKVINYTKKVINKTGFTLFEGEILGLIGESGSGKSVITNAVAGLLPETAKVMGGEMFLDGNNVTEWDLKSWNKAKIRGKVIGTVFQNPMGTLNPVMKIEKQMTEAMLDHKIVKTEEEAVNEAIKLLKKVRIHNAEVVLNLYPHELSGGMIQRVALATVLLLRPKVIVLDEPTTALDPSVQAEILDIINEIKSEFQTSFIFITHDLGVIASISDRVAIMYAGKIVEYGTTAEVLFNSKHPYTWGLLQSMPDNSVKDAELWTIPGSVPGDIGRIKGDAFAPRNPFALDIDFAEEPPMYKLSETHYASTWLLHEKAPKFEIPKIIKLRWDRYAEQKGK